MSLELIEALETTAEHVSLREVVRSYHAANDALAALRKAPPDMADDAACDAFLDGIGRHERHQRVLVAVLVLADQEPLARQLEAERLNLQSNNPPEWLADIRRTIEILLEQKS